LANQHAKRRLTVIEFMIAYRAGCVWDLIHGCDRRDSPELISKKSSGAEIAGIQNEVGLCASNDCGNFRYSPDSSPRQKLPMDVVRVHDHNMCGRLRGKP